MKFLEMDIPVPRVSVRRHGDSQLGSHTFAKKNGFRRLNG